MTDRVPIGAVTLEAFCGQDTIKTLIRSDKIDETVAWWSAQLDVLKDREPDGRQASQELVLQCFRQNRHHTDERVTEIICAALLWLVATGPMAPRFLPFMRRGDMTLVYEISRVEGNTWNFRVDVDEKTSRAMML